MRGFTLIEFLIIFSIIAIILSIGFPVFKAIKPDLELSGDVRDLTGDLRLAGRMSVTEQVSYGVIFSESKYDLVLFGENEEILDTVKTKELNENVFFETISFENNKVLFNSYGSVNEGGTILVKNSKGKTSLVKVTSAGFVKIES
jgi:type II secretory pathway pseudopilin PulG